MPRNVSLISTMANNSMMPPEEHHQRRKLKRRFERGLVGSRDVAVAIRADLRYACHGKQSLSWLLCSAQCPEQPCCIQHRLHLLSSKTVNVTAPSRRRWFSRILTATEMYLCAQRKICPNRSVEERRPVQIGMFQTSRLSKLRLSEVESRNWRVLNCFLFLCPDTQAQLSQAGEDHHSAA